MRGGSKAVWNFFKNSSLLVMPPFPNFPIGDMNSSPLVILYFYKCSFLDALSFFPVWINYLFANLYLLLNRWDRKKLGQPRQDELSSMIRRMDQEEEKERLHKENILLFVAAPKIPWCHKLFMIIYSHFSKTLQRKWELKETNSSHIIAEHCWCGYEVKWIFLTQFIFIGPRYTWAYFIFVTGTTGAARVKISVRCKFFQIERQKLHIWLFCG